MEDLRLKFTVPVTGTYEIAATDYYVFYSGKEDDTGRLVVGLTVFGVWRRTTGADPITKRRNAEDMIKALTVGWMGRKGDLKLGEASDSAYTGTNARTYLNVTLVNIVPKQIDNNEMIEFDLEFTTKLQGSIARIAQFGSRVMSCQNFVVIKDREQDRTAFKPVFHGASIRIPDYEPLKVIHLAALRRTIPEGFSPDLIRRQTAETDFKDMTDLKGTAATLIIDGITLGTYHLRNVTPTDLASFDFIAYELEFVGGYV